MQGLLAILRDDAAAHDDLDAALTLAEEEHVLPWTLARLKAQAATLPPEVAQCVAEAERSAAIAAFYWSSELKGLLRAFAEAAIAVIGLKGPCLAERIYGGAGLRSSRDLDLLVRAVDVARANALLEQQGFTPVAHPDDYHQPWRRGSTVVELHRNVENPLAFDFDIEGAWARAEASAFQGLPILRLAAADELLFLCLHGVRHRFDRMSLVLDLTLAFAHLDGTQPRPANADWAKLLYLGRTMARRLDAQIAPMPETDTHLDALADRLWERLTTQPAEPMDWAAAHAFYLEIERPGAARMRRRIRHWRILATRVIEPDYVFAARLGLRRRWQAALLRPLRLLLRIRS
jgi:hypothetical protein